MNIADDGGLTLLWIVVLAVAQILYGLAFLVDLYHFTRPVNRVDMSRADSDALVDAPFIILFYPVLNELEATMHTTLAALAHIDYPRDRYAIVAVPNWDDHDTIASLRRLQGEFGFLQISETPPTTDPSWDAVWAAWEANPKAYWWHRGRYAGVRDLPPKKTRQMIHAFYQARRTFADKGDFLVNYIDADSAPPRDHFKAGAIGMRSFDVLQSTNVAGNLNASLAASWHAFDHMAWDGMKYPHQSADGRHPYWMLGKGLFFRSNDLEQLGGLHPWVAIEDPEVGMRFWAAGKKLGIIENPLIEEVPETFGRGVTQRKRWVCGFFQSLSMPLTELGFTPWEKLKAWMNFLPCMSLWVNAIGFPIGVWAIVQWIRDADVIPLWLTVLCTINVVAYVLSMAALYVNTWKRTGLVLTRTSDRILYLLRINPLFLMVWWVIWLVPLFIGLRMYLAGGGLVWERTEKINANEDLIMHQVVQKA
ncbi:glycosyltransferase family 2 protein [Brevundimonas sp. PAMC22021]|uniref:glycosyltransferase family 2 protein n=1 Tax=Brevundimonas sp. PAMC22021 TaxID=2861285 RepID=UPI001C62CBC9|nr:glycosyltransferase family 2 protein [Brevundimonas sp. PAMC22021]QYF86856.1 glycosyltransferase [Brevundimonas sp. PAMC22021]